MGGSERLQTWVVNASPLILLARIGQLVWLEQLAPTVWVPEMVIWEVEVGKDKDSSAKVAIIDVSSQNQHPTQRLLGAAKAAGEMGDADVQRDYHRYLEEKYR